MPDYVLPGDDLVAIELASVSLESIADPDLLAALRSGDLKTFVNEVPSVLWAGTDQEPPLYLSLASLRLSIHTYSAGWFSAH